MDNLDVLVAVCSVTERLMDAECCMLFVVSFDVSAYGKGFRGFFPVKAVIEREEKATGVVQEGTTVQRCR